MGIVVEANLPQTSKSHPQNQERRKGREGGSVSESSMNPIIQKNTKKVQEDRGHEWVTYVREPASPGALARAPTKKFLKTTNTRPRSGLLYTGWSEPFRIERVDDYQVARQNGMTFSKERIGDAIKHETLVCGTDGPYTGDLILILEFDPLDKVIQLGGSKV